MTSTGYDGPKGEAPEPLPSPDSRSWTVETVPSDSGEASNLSILIDGVNVGFIRLPDNEHVRWFRDRVQGDCISKRDLEDFKEKARKELDSIKEEIMGMQAP